MNENKYLTTAQSPACFILRVVRSALIIKTMKITVKIDNIEITVDEQGQNERTVTMKYSDQNEQVQKTIKVMAEECIKLREACRS